MSLLRATLHTDGSSDRVLLPVVRWTLAQNTRVLCDVKWADPRALPRASGLAARIRLAVDFYPCDLLFVHRDAEGDPREQRVSEIRTALEGRPATPAVCVVPVRMQEAWFLFDEKALREAAGNPRGRVALDMPKPHAVERLPAKERLHDLLRQASELRGRRLRSFNADVAVHLLAERIDDFAPLRSLSAFQMFEHELRDVLRQNGWLRDTA